MHSIYANKKNYSFHLLSGVILSRCGHPDKLKIQIIEQISEIIVNETPMHVPSMMCIQVGDMTVSTTLRYWTFCTI